MTEERTTDRSVANALADLASKLVDRAEDMRRHDQPTEWLELLNRLGPGEVQQWFEEIQIAINNHDQHFEII